MGAVRFEHVAPQNQPREFAGPHDFNQSCGFQFLQMVRERRCRYGLALSYLRAGDARLVRAYLLQNVVPPRVRQRFGDQLNLGFRQLCCFGGHAGFSVSSVNGCAGFQ